MSSSNQRRRKREEDATRPIPREEVEQAIKSKVKDPREQTMDLQIDDLELIADEEVTRGDPTGKVIRRNTPPIPDDDLEIDIDIESAALPGIGSKLMRVAKSIRNKK